MQKNEYLLIVNYVRPITNERISFPLPVTYEFEVFDGGDFLSAMLDTCCKAINQQLKTLAQRKDVSFIPYLLQSQPLPRTWEIEK